jgi:hypothetical protein
MQFKAANKFCFSRKAAKKNLCGFASWRDKFIGEIPKIR